MSKRVLVTDSLFIFDEHISQLRDAGFDVERLDKPAATEEELCRAIKGKVGYILGGVEKVTDTVIESADELKAIVFTGIGFQAFIPGWQLAADKGIAIGNVPDGPTDAVAEWAVMAALMMNRGVAELDVRQGDKTFLTTKGLKGQDVGIVGLGRIGTRIAELLQLFKVGELNYYSPHRHEDKERQYGLKYFSKLNNLLQNSDIVFLGIPDSGGANSFGKDEVANMRPGSLLVSYVHDGIVAPDSLYEAVAAGRIRAVSDYPVDDRLATLPASSWYSHKISNAFNTTASLKHSSDAATATLINLLKTGNDKHKVV